MEVISFLECVLSEVQLYFHTVYYQLSLIMCMYLQITANAVFDVVFVFHCTGRVIHSQTFKFTPNAAESCQNLLIPSRELDLFSDTTFTAHVAVLPESGVRLGEMSTAVIIMVGIDGKNHDITVIRGGQSF